MIICRVLKGAVFDADIRERLFNLAVRMYHKDISRCPFREKEPLCEGVVSTDGSYAALGFYGGRLYTAEVESRRGKSIISFVVDVGRLTQADMEFQPDHWLDRMLGQVDDETAGLVETLLN